VPVYLARHSAMYALGSGSCLHTRNTAVSHRANLPERHHLPDPCLPAHTGYAYLP